MQNLRKCRTCGLEANNEDELNLFKRSKSSSYGRDNECKQCDNNRYSNAVTKGSETRDKVLKQKRNNHFRFKYGMTLEQRDNYILSVGKCEICGKGLNEKTAHIDHSHTKHKHVRGVLCNNCNTGLGKFGDNIEMLNKAMRYLIEREHMVDSQIFSLQATMDTLYHGGYDAWKASIQAIKDQFPKG